LFYGKFSPFCEKHFKKNILSKIPFFLGKKIQKGGKKKDKLPKSSKM